MLTNASRPLDALGWHFIEARAGPGVASDIGRLDLSADKPEYGSDETVRVRVKFSLAGDVREAFTEKNWTAAYDANDNLFKLKYGVKLVSSGLVKRGVGDPVESYRKASIFWTRNPKLVNPMTDRRIWVQVAKNFVPYVRLTEEEVRSELFDFDEEIPIPASRLGRGSHGLGAEAWASWKKHLYVEAGEAQGSAGGAEITVR